MFRYLDLRTRDTADTPPNDLVYVGSDILDRGWESGIEKRRISFTHPQYMARQCPWVYMLTSGDGLKSGIGCGDHSCAYFDDFTMVIGRVASARIYA